MVERIRIIWGLIGNVPVSLIAQGLRSFIPSFENTPGRMNLFCFHNYCVLVDYPPNPQGLAALGDYIKQASVVHKWVS